MDAYDTTLKTTAGKSRYDAAVVQLLSYSPLISRIVKSCVDIYKDCTLEEIESLIEGKPEIFVIPLDRNIKPVLENNSLQPHLCCSL